ncbi:ATP-binding protein [Deinococcus humi]|uniref:ATP/maltotriose-dependent transcriptional regulator MalT n=1 Tax=Deinococcus humi TaxID=662880 RepID=A0A7W8NDP7_9DEIO|nr:AAA family ATPase [Deinococcus humi]MBB5363449.1 ATP/maltotriose-dependent transcriptional regulator MalT [Deinococcus humi]GGO26454.1 LuxR family transcriptional regulator [Deinococcus humi]
MTLLERAVPLDQLLAWSGDAAAGRGRLILLAGEAGVGKTVFLQEFVRRLARPNGVLLGACDPLSTPRPLGPLLDIASLLGGEFERLLDSGQREQVFRAFLSVLTNDRHRGHIVIFEDVHWADDATLDLLRFLGRRLDHSRTLLIASYRDDEVGPRHPLRTVIGDLATSQAARRLTLAPLSQVAVQELAQANHMDPTLLYLKTEGNPFYITEVIASGVENIPPTILDAVLARAARLSPPARAALEAAAAIGTRIEPWLLEALVPSSVEAVDECLSMGVLQAHDDRLAFRHELARQAILSSTAPPQRLALHREILGVLMVALPGDVARLADHAEAANDSAAVLRYALRAAREAMALRAHREACAQFARVLRHAGGLAPEEHASMLEEYAEQCFITDQLAEALRASEAALQLWQETGQRDREGATLARLARFLVGMGRNAEAEDASRRSLAILGELPPGPPLAFAYACQAHLRMLNRDNQQAVHWGQQAIELAEQHQDRPLLVLALNTVGTAMLLEQDEAGRALLDRSLALARDAQLDDHVALAYRMLSSVAGELYQFARADQYFGDGLRYCQEHDLDGHRLYMLAWQALSYLYQGRWREATEVALSVTRRPATAATSRIMALVALGRVRTRRGDPEVWDVLDEALAMASQTGTLQRLAPVRAARAEAAWLAGDLDRVHEEAQAAYGLACHHHHPWFVGELAYWRWKAGHASSDVPRMALPYELQITGRWHDAALEWERLNCPYEAARAYAESQAEPDLKQALALFKQLGARPAATQAVQQLRQLGVKGLSLAPRSSASDHPARVTPREVQVLQLLQRGLRDAEIARELGVSTKTAGHHVSSLLSKLSVRNRTEAVREGTRMGLIPYGEPDRSA